MEERRTNERPRQRKWTSCRASASCRVASGLGSSVGQKKGDSAKSLARRSRLPSYFGRGEFAFLSSNLPSLHSYDFFHLERCRPASAGLLPQKAVGMELFSIFLGLEYGH